ncbi:AAA family ATPase [Anatilimnocola sp. NA78]|uniref:AAA family ATPase n=1 Tax=Anatilimnocola sp. NA78 TaxID=3415683 RepID=UPI003CE51700
MATAEQVKALLRSYGEGNGEHFASVALQIAADAARGGKGQLAQQLRTLVDDIKRKQAAGKVGGAVPIARPVGELGALLVASYPQTRLSEMVLSHETELALKRVLHEYRSQSRLREHGYSARRKLLLVGPSGCGKTMTASALAGELKLPLFSVQLHGLITKFMGETAAKLRMIFDAMVETQGVYFYDEFDAIGADRGAKNDVGEIRRILNSFLQFLEQDDSDSIVIAATNYEAMLDDALFRRFDDVIRYSRPDPEQIATLIRNRLRIFLGSRPAWTKIREAADGLSHAEIARACDDAAKHCILQERNEVKSGELIAMLHDRRRIERAADSDDGQQ